jgi:hypothetical protein
MNVSHTQYTKRPLNDSTARPWLGLRRRLRGLGPHAGRGPADGRGARLLRAQQGGVPSHVAESF